MTELHCELFGTPKEINCLGADHPQNLSKEWTGLRYLPPPVGLRSEQEQQDFFSVRKYTQWLSKGCREGLTSYKCRDSGPRRLLGDTILGQETFMALSSFLQPIFPCLPLLGFSHGTGNWSHLGPAKGLPVAIPESPVALACEENESKPDTTAVEPVNRINDHEFFNHLEKKKTVDCNRLLVGAPHLQIGSPRPQPHYSIALQLNNGVSMLRRAVTYACCLFPSRRPSLDETTCLLKPASTERHLPSSLADPRTFLIQPSAAPLPKEYGISKLGGLPIRPDWDASYYGVDAPLPCLNGNLSASGRYQYLFPCTDNSLHRSTLFTTDWAFSALRSPIDINNCHIPLILMQGPPEVRNSLTRMLRASHGKAALDIDEDILQQAKPVLPHLPIMDPNWRPPGRDLNMSPEELAMTMDVVCFYPFQVVSFPFFRDTVYGARLEPVKDIVKGFACMRDKLSQLFTTHPDKRALYEEAKKVCHPIQLLASGMLNLVS